MMSATVSTLKDALAKSPENLLLRLALTRRLIDDGEDGEAITLAVEINASEVTSDSDRSMLASLLDRAGLPDLAAPFETCNRVDNGPRLGSDDAQTLDVGNAPESRHDKPVKVPLHVVAGTDRRDYSNEDHGELQNDIVDFGSVGGLEDVKRDIKRRIILPFSQPTLISRFGKQAGGGVLLYGPPGCGKTMLAKATAGECGAQFLHAPLSEILDPYSGIPERRLSALFEKARGSAPAILFFDEIEALAAKRSTATASHVSQLISHFLYELDGVDTDNKGVLVLAATNTPWAMDPAFLRPGRFDRMFFVPPPDKVARQMIFTLELGGRPQAQALDTTALASRTAGLSGADIKQIVDRATDRAIDLTLEQGEEQPIEQEMLLTAAQSCHSTVGDWLSTAKDYATYANESGRYDDVLEFIDQYRKRK